MADEQKQDTTNNPKDIVIPPAATTEYVTEPETDIPNTDTKQTEKEYNSKEATDIKVNVQKEKKNPAVTANNIARFATFISFIVGGFTILLFWQTKNAISIADKANAIADSSRKTSDSIGKANLNLAQDMFTEQKASGEQSDIANKLLYQAAQKSAGVAEKTLLENKRSAEFYRESIMNENRAYIIMPKIIALYKIDTIISVEATIQNVGKTPAYYVKSDVRIVMSPSADKVNTYGYIDRIDTATAMTIGATQTTYQTSRSLANVNQIDDDRLRNKIVTMFAVVTITYNDIFNKQHYTRGFFEYDMKTTLFNVCKTYNEAN